LPTLDKMGADTIKKGVIFFFRVNKSLIKLHKILDTIRQYVSMSGVFANNNS